MDYTEMKKQKHIEGLKAKKELYLHMKRYNNASKIQDRIGELTKK